MSPEALYCAVAGGPNVAVFNPEDRLVPNRLPADRLMDAVICFPSVRFSMKQLRDTHHSRDVVSLRSPRTYFTLNQEHRPGSTRGCRDNLTSLL